MGGGSVGLAVYDDRLEVMSTDPLHFGLTPDNLFAPHESRPWNPLVARTFHRRGVIEQWGRGTLRMAQPATAAGLPRPEIEECADSVTVRFRRSDHHAVRRADDDLTDQQNAVLEVLRGSYPLRCLIAARPRVLSQVLGVIYRAISTSLIKEAGFTVASGTKTRAVTLIQRFGSALNPNIHFHMLFLDGVYESCSNSENVASRER